MSPSTRAARAMVDLMRAGPALFATGLVFAATVFLAQGRLEWALAATVGAVLAAGFGARITLFSRR